MLFILLIVLLFITETDFEKKKKQDNSCRSRTRSDLQSTRTAQCSGPERACLAYKARQDKPRHDLHTNSNNDTQEINKFDKLQNNFNKHIWAASWAD